MQFWLELLARGESQRWCWVVVEELECELSRKLIDLLYWSVFSPSESMRAVEIRGGQQLKYSKREREHYWLLSKSNWNSLPSLSSPNSLLPLATLCCLRLTQRFGEQEEVRLLTALLHLCGWSRLRLSRELIIRSLAVWLCNGEEKWDGAKTRPVWRLVLPSWGTGTPLHHNGQKQKHRRLNQRKKNNHFKTIENHIRTCCVCYGVGDGTWAEIISAVNHYGGREAELDSPL